MAIWLGEAGGIRLERLQTDAVYSYVDASSVDVAIKRFGFKDAPLSLITGDRVWIQRVDESGNPVSSPLDFVAPTGWPDGVRHNDGEWFVNQDRVGGIRLYKTWEAALKGAIADAVALATPSSEYRVSYEVIKDLAANCLAQTVSWTLNTNRDVADFTSLGDGFKQQQGTLVSGSGELDCLFDVPIDDSCEGYGNKEVSMYLHQLVLRQELGSTFRGVFLLKRSGAIPLGTLLDPVNVNRELFYVADCVVTNVATELIPAEPVHSKIQFVTTGPIQLLYDYPSGYLLQEQPPNGKVLQESGFGILLETPD
jgi:hypothetical protein